MNIVIVDYGLGNLQSVYNALVSLGAEPKIVDSPSQVDSADKLILPGVGAFKDTIEGLQKKRLFESIKRYLKTGKTYLGICLGLQILFEGSEEGEAKGLCVFKGKVKRFKKREGVKIPHMGWNSVRLSRKDSAIKLMKGIKDSSYFYFVHSYYADPEDKGIVAAATDYAGMKFSSMIVKDNVYATQFHPEKSQEKGLKFLKNFLDI